MSIINQVLKDLDQQRGPNDGLQVAALQGVGLVRGERPAIWPLAAVVAGVLATLAMGYKLTSSGEPVTDYQVIEPLLVDNAQPAQVAAPAQPATESDSTESTLLDGSGETAVVAELVDTGSLEVTETSIESSAAESTPAAMEEETATTPVIKTLSPRQQADHAFASAQRALESQDRVAAEKQYRAALDLYPQHLSARLQLVGLYLNRDLDDRAARLLQEGLVLNGMDRQLVRPYAQLLAARGDLGEALRLLAPLTDTTDPDPESLALSAAIHARLHRHDDAAALYASAIKLDGLQGNWWLGLGLSLEQQGHFTDAQRAYRRAVDLPLADNVQAFVAARIQELDSREEGN